MFFSPLSSQFAHDNVSRGSSWEMNIEELINANQYNQALNLVDSLIEVKSQNLSCFAYFDRFLSEDERMDAANTRADVYELQWKRIEILKATNQINALRDALEDYVDVIGYNQDAAKALLKPINSK
jgi:negative regulator of sigma E activity